MKKVGSVSKPPVFGLMNLPTRVTPRVTTSLNFVTRSRPNPEKCPFSGFGVAIGSIATGLTGSSGTCNIIFGLKFKNFIKK